MLFVILHLFDQNVYLFLIKIYDPEANKQHSNDIPNMHINLAHN